MNREELVLKLLQKGELDAKEKQQFNELLREDQELHKLYAAYKRIESAGHISYEELGEYVLYKNGIPTEDKSIIAKIPVIEKHLRECAKCSGEFKLLNSEYAYLDDFLTGQIPAQKPAGNIIQTPVNRGNNLVLKYSLTSVLTAGFLYLVIFFISGVSIPGYYNAAHMDNGDDFYVTRGRASGSFQESIKALENKDYNNVIKWLQKDINENENDETIFYSHYILGLTYLESAGKSFLGLFPSYDKAKAEKALQELQKSIDENKSGRFNNIPLDAYYYMGKANLMLDRTADAKECFNKVVAGKGSKMKEAAGILKELE